MNGTTEGGPITSCGECITNYQILMRDRSIPSLPPPLVVPLEFFLNKASSLSRELEQIATAWKKAGANSEEEGNAEKSGGSCLALVADLFDVAFSEPSMATEFSERFDSDEQTNFAEELTDAHRYINVLCRKLEFRAEIHPSKAEPQSPSSTESPPVGRKVFVVHGHDVAVRESVARYLTQLGLEPVILHEQADEGKAIIEKFEKHANVFCAVVLLTPDDTGGPRSEGGKTKPRARQNVIFELGYFVGRLGRSRVCVLHRGDVEIPSDYHGVIYVPLDEHGAWKLITARNLRSAGLPVDMNLAL